MRLRWYVTDRPCIDYESPINSRDLNFDQWNVIPLGELPEWQSPRKYNGQWTRPASATGTRYCHAEFLQTGEPWPNNLPSQGYDVEHIPLCCGCPVCCDFVSCNRDDVSGAPASRFDQFAILPENATDDTPRLRQAVLDVAEEGPPALKGFNQVYLPLGVNGAAGWQSGARASAAGVMVSGFDQFTIDADNLTRTQADASGWQVTQRTGGIETALRLLVSGGVGSLTGTNLQIDPAIGQGFEPRRTEGTVLASGLTQATATPITTDAVNVASTNTNLGAILPNKAGALVVVKVQGSTAIIGAKIYPPTGAALGNLGLNAPLTVVDRNVYLFTRISATRWSYVQLALTAN